MSNLNALTPIKFLYKNKYDCKIWEFKCQCGNKRIANLAHVKNNSMYACKECTKKFIHYKRKAAAEKNSSSIEYKTLTNIKARCYNKKNKYYKNYGGRGIKVCDRWLKSHKNFINDMGRRPNKNYTVDRIDNDGDYTPENCRWATRFEQMNNTRRNVFLTFNNVTLTITQWSRTEYAKTRGLNFGVLQSRHYRGWGVERMFTQEVAKKKTTCGSVPNAQ